MLRGLRHPQGAIQKAGDPDGQTEGAALQWLRDVPTDLLAEDGELAERGAEGRLLKPIVADEAEHRGEEEEQWEHGQESVKRDERRERRAAVIAVLLHDGEQERGHTASLLRVIDGAHRPLDKVHPPVLPGRRPVQCFALLEVAVWV